MKKIIAFIPNLLTLCNLMCGVLAIYASFNGDNIMAFWAIITASVFDFSDGFAARLLNARSDIGMQLDSLSDMVSFGVAPAIIMCNSLSQTEFSLPYMHLIALLLAPFAAYRLAKFNVDTRQSEEFRGLATPAMALFVISYVNYFIPKIQELGIFSEISILISLALSIMMVIDTPMFSLKFKNYSLKKNILRYSFLISSVLILSLCGMYAGIAVVIAFYSVLSLIAAAVKSPKRAEN